MVTPLMPQDGTRPNLSPPPSPSNTKKYSHFLVPTTDGDCQFKPLKSRVSKKESKPNHKVDKMDKKKLLSS